MSRGQAVRRLEPAGDSFRSLLTILSLRDLSRRVPRRSPGGGVALHSLSDNHRRYGRLRRRSQLAKGKGLAGPQAVSGHRSGDTGRTHSDRLIPVPVQRKVIAGNRPLAHRCRRGECCDVTRYLSIHCDGHDCDRPPQPRLDKTAAVYHPNNGSGPGWIKPLPLNQLLRENRTNYGHRISCLLGWRSPRPAQ